MYRNKIRNEVGEIFKGIFTPEDYVIHFGYFKLYIFKIVKPLHIT